MTETAIAAQSTFVTEVVAAEPLTPLVRTVTFGGGLDGFTTLGPDTFFYVLLPPPGESDLTVGRDFTWEQFRTLPDARRPRGAYYTVRRHRVDAGEVDLEMVLHGDGDAAAWAGAAVPGKCAALWGPRRLYEPPTGTRNFLLFADDTAMPAAANIIESLGQDTRVHLVADVADRHEERTFISAASVEVTWLRRNGAPAGLGSALLEVAATLDVPVDDTYVWGGGESRAMTAIRNVMRHCRGFAPETISLTGYWRRTGMAGCDDDD